MKLDDFLDLVIPHLKTLQKDENAEPFYELMSGAFIWEDEKVRGLNTYELGCLRGIFRYRTSLITREPDERFASLWNALREKYPNWIGFAPERCSPNDAFVERYRKEREKVFSVLGIVNELKRNPLLRICSQAGPNSWCAGQIDGVSLSPLKFDAFTGCQDSGPLLKSAVIGF